MDLQPAKKIDAPGIPGRAPVELTAQQQQLINIRVAPVTQGQVSRDVRAVGVITYDTTRIAEVNARIMGWVEKLHVDKPGQAVRAGEPLMAIYSPELYSAQREYLLAWRQANSNPTATSNGGGSGQLAQYLATNRDSVRSLLESARRRLELWGISDQQIAQLQETGQATDSMELLAPISGVVVEKPVNPMQMVQPGMKLYQLADLSQVWLEVDVFEYELALIEEGQQATVTLAAYPGETFDGTVDFIYPFVQEKTRTIKVRLVMPNPDLRLRPDMYATAINHVALGDRVTVPATAVFDTGRRQYVFVQESEGIFVPKLITLGPKTGDRFVVQSGVAAGEQVVVDGNFLLDSESQLKAAASGSSEDEEDVSASQPGAEAAGSAAPPPLEPMPESAQPAVDKLLAAYFEAHDALTRDTLEGVPDMFTRMKAAAEELKAAAPTSGPHREQYVELLDAVARRFDAPPSSDLQRARVQFGSISEALIGLFGRFPPPLERPLNVAFCPMWQDSPAQWLQRESQVENPFMGQAMPACGEITDTIEGR